MWFSSQNFSVAFSRSTKFRSVETFLYMVDLLLVNWGRGIFENTTSQIEKTLSLFGDKKKSFRPV